MRILMGHKTKRCSVDGCQNNSRTRGYCDKHYRRFRIHGSPHIVKNLRNVSPFDRIMAKVVVDKKTGCWNFTGYLDVSGYGKIGIMGKSTPVHRFVYEHYKGKVPDNLCVCHSCDNPKCCNPKHLWTGTRTSNNMDRHLKGRTCHGDNHQKSKLTVKNVKIIRKIYTKYGKKYKFADNWCTQKFLADEFNVSVTAIQQVTSNRCWKEAVNI